MYADVPKYVIAPWQAPSAHTSRSSPRLERFGSGDRLRSVGWGSGCPDGSPALWGPGIRRHAAAACHGSAIGEWIADVSTTEGQSLIKGIDACALS